jgi:hypothetical protein
MRTFLLGAFLTDFTDLADFTAFIKRVDFVNRVGFADFGESRLPVCLAVSFLFSKLNCSLPHPPDFTP